MNVPVLSLKVISGEGSIKRLNNLVACSPHDRFTIQKCSVRLEMCHINYRLALRPDPTGSCLQHSPRPPSRLGADTPPAHSPIHSTPVTFHSWLLWRLRPLGPRLTLPSGGQVVTPAQRWGRIDSAQCAMVHPTIDNRSTPRVICLYRSCFQHCSFSDKKGMWPVKSFLNAVPRYVLLYCNWEDSKRLICIFFITVSLLNVSMKQKIKLLVTHALNTVGKTWYVYAFVGAKL